MIPPPLVVRVWGAGVSTVGGRGYVVRVGLPADEVVPGVGYRTHLLGPPGHRRLFPPTLSSRLAGLKSRNHQFIGDDN